jgi:hypothetical protein
MTAEEICGKFVQDFAGPGQTTLDLDGLTRMMGSVVGSSEEAARAYASWCEDSGALMNVGLTADELSKVFEEDKLVSFYKAFNEKGTADGRGSAAKERKVGGEVGGEVEAKWAAAQTVEISGCTDRLMASYVNGLYAFKSRDTYRKVGDGGSWLYVAADGKWYTGWTGAKSERFRKPTGSARTVAAAGGLPPAAGAVKWEIGDKWHPAVTLQVKVSSTASSGMSETAPSQGSEDDLDIGAQADDIIDIPPRWDVRGAPAESIPAAIVTRATALQGFDSGRRGDVAFARGDTVEIINTLPGQGWWTGRCRGATGIFPANHVRPQAGPKAPGRRGPPARRPIPAPSGFTASPIKETTQQIMEKLQMEQEAHNTTKNELKRTEIDLLATKKELVATKKKMADLEEKIGAAEAGPAPPKPAAPTHVGKIEEVPELDEGHNR